MSYDFDLEVDTGGPAPYVIDLGINYTANVAPIWDRALTGSGVDHLYDLNGRSARACIATLQHAIGAMMADIEGFKALNPANGWGDAPGALEILIRLRKKCELHPNGKLRITR